MHLLSRLMPSTNGKLKIFLVALGYASATTHSHQEVKCNSGSFKIKKSQGGGELYENNKEQEETYSPLFFIKKMNIWGC